MGDPSPALPRLGQIALHGLGIIIVAHQQSSQVLEHQNLLQFLAVRSKLRLKRKLGVSCCHMLSLPCAQVPTELRLHVPLAQGLRRSLHPAQVASREGQRAFLWDDYCVGGMAHHEVTP